MGMRTSEKRMQDLPMAGERKLMAAAKPGAMVQHCQPPIRAEKSRPRFWKSIADEIFEEAENRLHARSHHAPFNGGKKAERKRRKSPPRFKKIKIEAPAPAFCGVRFLLPDGEKNRPVKTRRIYKNPWAGAE
jgi:hypothetical protein